MTEPIGMEWQTEFGKALRAFRHLCYEHCIQLAEQRLSGKAPSITEYSILIAQDTIEILYDKQVALYSASQARVAELEAAIERHRDSRDKRPSQLDTDLWAILKGE